MAYNEFDSRDFFKDVGLATETGVHIIFSLNPSPMHPNFQILDSQQQSISK
jgi:hypothetical protein